MREIKKHKFSKIFDLQNSSRSLFYKNILLPKATCEVWSSSYTTLPDEKSKDEFEILSKRVENLEKKLSQTKSKKNKNTKLVKKS